MGVITANWERVNDTKLSLTIGSCAERMESEEMGWRTRFSHFSSAIRAIPTELHILEEPVGTLERQWGP